MHYFHSPLCHLVLLNMGMTKFVLCNRLTYIVIVLQKYGSQTSFVPLSFIGIIEMRNISHPMDQPEIVVNFCHTAPLWSSVEILISLNTALTVCWAFCHPSIHSFMISIWLLNGWLAISSSLASSLPSPDKEIFKNKASRRKHRKIAKAALHK